MPGSLLLLKVTIIQQHLTHTASANQRRPGSGAQEGGRPPSPSPPPPAEIYVGWSAEGSKTEVVPPRAQGRSLTDRGWSSLFLGGGGGGRKGGGVCAGKGRRSYAESSLCILFYLPCISPVSIPQDINTGLIRIITFTRVAVAMPVQCFNLSYLNTSC